MCVVHACYYIVIQQRGVRALLLGKGAQGGVSQEQPVDWDAPVAKDDDNHAFGATGNSKTKKYNITSCTPPPYILYIFGRTNFSLFFMSFHLLLMYVSTLRLMLPANSFDVIGTLKKVGRGTQENHMKEYFSHQIFACMTLGGAVFCSRPDGSLRLDTCGKEHIERRKGGLCVFMQRGYLFV